MPCSEERTGVAFDLSPTRLDVGTRVVIVGPLPEWSAWMLGRSGTVHATWYTAGLWDVTLDMPDGPMTMTFRRDNLRKVYR